MVERPPPMLPLVLGLFGQIAFFADYGRGALPAPLRVAVHLAPLLPLLFVEPGRARRRAEGRAERACQALRAFAGVTYAGLSAASLALVAAGARPPGVWFYLALQAPGAVVALATALNAARALRPLRPRPERPFVGAYRTRAVAPPLAPPRPRRRPPASDASGRWALVGYLFVSLGFSAAGLFMTLRPRRPDDVLMGYFCMALFGFGAWVFGEQLRADGRRSAPTAAARRRGLTALRLLGAGLRCLAIAGAQASPHVRALVGLAGAAFGLLGAWGRRRAMTAIGRLPVSLPPGVARRWRGLRESGRAPGPSRTTGRGKGRVLTPMRGTDKTLRVMPQRLALSALVLLLLSGPAFAQAPPPLPAAEGEPDATPASRVAEQPAALPPPPAYAAPPPAELTPGVHRHDGFYLRLALGPGFGASDGEVYSDRSEFGASGFAVASTVMLGGTPAPGLVVGGAVAGHTLPRPKYGADVDVEGRPAASLGLVYGFVDYFPNPRRGFHVGGGAGLASLSYESTNGDAVTTAVAPGVGGAAWVGYDAWVGKQWSLGIETRALGAHVGNGGSNGPARSINAFGGAVLFTALYH